MFLCVLQINPCEDNLMLQYNFDSSKKIIIVADWISCVSMWIALLLFISFLYENTLKIVSEFSSIRREFKKFCGNLNYSKTSLFVDEWISLLPIIFLPEKAPSIPFFQFPFSIPR